MSQQIKTKYYKVPLRSIKNITEENYQQQKVANVLSKEFREDKDTGFNNVCFTNEYQLPTTLADLQTSLFTNNFKRKENKYFQKINYQF